MVEIVEDLKRLHLLDLDFTRAGADAANLLERIVGRNLRVAAGGGRSSGGAGRSSFRFRVLRKCRRSKKTGGHEQLAFSIQIFLIPSSVGPCWAPLNFCTCDQSQF